MSLEREHFRHTLAQHAQQQPGITALWGDHQVDYATLYSEVINRQQQLREAQATIVALALDNGVEAMLWDLAVLFAGLTCLLLPPFFNPAQRAHCLEQSQADLVIATGEFDDELHAAGYEKSAQFWRRHSPGHKRIPQGTAKLTFTSGTTGTPKGVCLSAESLLSVARALDQASSANTPRHHLTLLPLAILLENLGAYAALLAGATLSVPSMKAVGIQGASAVDSPRLLELLARRAPHSVILVPQLLSLLVNAAEQQRFDPQSLRFVAVGGAYVSTQLLDRAQRLGIPVYEGYGLSECASVVCLNRPQACRPGSVGQALPHVQVRLAEDGEILVKGPTLLGYLGDAAPTCEWWPTGDLGAFDAQGFLYLKGRKKHQFVTSFGRNVNPEWVEAELTQRGVIAQAFVYGEALPRNHALLWPTHPDCTDAQLSGAVAEANQALPDYARVHRWTRLQQPFTAANALLTANGRPRREAIVERYRAQLTEVDLYEERLP